jgi:4-amino-4-deoxy-L-arabinose transferase-like glycosyltransferase
VRRGSNASYLLAGLACGLALGALQYGLFTLPCLLLAHLLARRSEPRPFCVRILECGLKERFVEFTPRARHSVPTRAGHA